MANRTMPKVHTRSQDLVLVGDELIDDETSPFLSRGDLAIMGMEIDRQIATAKRFPRDETSAELKAKKMVTISEDIAMGCIYALPRAGKIIPGASVRLAETMAYCWGNARYGSKIVDEEDEFIVAQAFFFDLERNIQNGKTVRRRITNTDGIRYNTDMIQTTGMAAMSIALRNAILNGGIPTPIWQPVYDSAAAIIGGETRPLSVRRQMAVDAFVKLGVPAEKVLARIKVQSVEKMEQDHIVQLRGLRQAIKDEVLTLEAAFPEPRQKDKRTDVGAKVREGAKAAAESAGEGAQEAAQTGQDGAMKPAGKKGSGGKRKPASDAPAGDGGAKPTEADKTAEQMANLGKAVEAEVEQVAETKAAQETGLPQEDRDVLDELRALLPADTPPAERRKAAADFKEAIEAMTPAGRAAAERVIGLPTPDGQAKLRL